MKCSDCLCENVTLLLLRTGPPWTELPKTSLLFEKHLELGGGGGRWHRASPIEPEGLREQTCWKEEEAASLLLACWYCVQVPEASTGKHWTVVMLTVDPRRAANASGRIMEGC